MKTLLARRQTVTAISTPRWLGYATAAAATAALGHAQTAEAAVVVVPENLSFDAPDNFSPARGTLALGSGGAYFGLTQFHSSGGKGFVAAVAKGAASLLGSVH